MWYLFHSEMLDLFPLLPSLLLWVGKPYNLTNIFCDVQVSSCSFYMDFKKIIASNTYEKRSWYIMGYLWSFKTSVYPQINCLYHNSFSLGSYIFNHSYPYGPGLRRAESPRFESRLYPILFISADHLLLYRLPLLLCQLVLHTVIDLVGLSSLCHTVVFYDNC